MNGQCECGSRAFVFIRDAERQKSRIPGAENIYMPEPGVFELNLESLAKSTAVLLDENGVYHVLLGKKEK